MPYGTEDVTMTTPQEQLSALVDGELPDHDSDRLLVALASDPALRDQWSRYQLIGTAIRRGVPDMHDPGLAQRIAAAVSEVEPEGDVEPLPAARDNRAPGRLRRAASGLAMAASVAALALVGARFLGAPDAGSGTPQVASVTPPWPSRWPARAATLRARGQHRHPCAPALNRCPCPRLPSACCCS